MIILRHTYILLIISLLFILTVTACGRMGSQSESAWYIDDSLSNIAIVVVDFETLQLERAYFTKQEVCQTSRPPVSDEELISRASGLFNAVGKSWSRRLMGEVPHQWEELRIELTHVGNLALLEIPPGDFGGFAVSHACSGLVLYAGSIVFAGRGKQLYPAIPLPANSLQRSSGFIEPPQKLDLLITPSANSEQADAIKAWTSIQGLNLVRELATEPYRVFVYLYPRSVGMFNPSHADWVIFIERAPDPNPYKGPTATPWPTIPPTIPGPAPSTLPPSAYPYPEPYPYPYPYP